MLHEALSQLKTQKNKWAEKYSQERQRAENYRAELEKLQQQME